MTSTPKYSIVVPVYNRPQELEELLRSLELQDYNEFEVIIVEDGSSITSEKIYEQFVSKLAIQYFFKPNSGPGPSRNFGFEKARGAYLVVFDSDCILPPQYFVEVEKALAQNVFDAWGGPDRGHEKFSNLQRAMAFTMSSVLTTGGIRGGENQAENFQPRSFNMGISRKVFEVTGGFKLDRLAEDIDLSIRMRKAGFKVVLIPGAFVYHKRRTDLPQFFQQVQGFGRGRVRVGKIHGGSVKLTHWFPTAFLLALVLFPIIYIIDPRLAIFDGLAISLYLLAIFADAIVKTNSPIVALLSLPAAIVQLCGYGLGFLKEKLR
jgi:glycosyltransferase involved in cell wall biosynthesis